MIGTKKNVFLVSLILLLFVCFTSGVCHATVASKISEFKNSTRPAAKITTVQYGVSGMGRPLNYIKIEPARRVKSKVLVVFEIHGWEDAYPRDGQVLVDIANRLIQYFTEHPEKLGNTALYVVPSANPDGLADGWTNNGPGRCQVSLGVDINRDFDHYWVRLKSSRHKTLEPFSAPETQALRDLVVNLQPDDVIDIHGWAGYVKGSCSLTGYFLKTLRVMRFIEWDGSPGEFYAWARKYAQRTALIELPDPDTDPQAVIDAFVDLCAESQENGSGQHSPVERR